MGMNTRMEIDVRYLNKNELQSFLKVKDKLETCYREALKALKVDIPYVPRLYIIPFLKKMVSEGMYKFVWNTLGTDVWCKPKFAIFPALPFIERAAERDIISSLAHELAHLIDIAQTPSIRKIKKNASLRKTDLMFEERVRNMFQYFDEPVRSYLQEWVSKSKDPNFSRPIILNAPFQIFTSYEQFDRYLQTKPEPKRIQVALKI